MTDVFAPSDRLVIRLATNTVIQAAGTALGSLIAFFTFVAVTRGLGPEAYGDYTASIVFIFIPVVLVDIGLSTAVVRQISARPETTGPVMRTTIPLRVVVSALVVTVILAAALVAPVTDRTRTGIAIGSVGAIALLLTGSVSPVFQAQLKQHWYVLANVAGRVATLGLTLAFLALDYGFEGVVWANVVGLWTTMVVSVAAATRFVSLRPAIDAAAWRGIVKGAAALALALGLAQVYLRLDVLLLAFLKPEYEVGIYGAAWRFIEVAGFIAGGVTVTILPALSRFVASDDVRLRRITRKSLDVMLAAAIPIAVLYAAFARDIVVVTAGEEFPEAGDALRILAPYVPMMFVGGLFWSVLIAHEADRTLLKLGAAAVGSNILLNLVLIPPFGYQGAAAAAVASEVLALVLGAVAVARVQGLPSPRYLVVLVPAALVMVALIVLLPGPALVVGGAAAAAYAALVATVPGTGREVVGRMAGYFELGQRTGRVRTPAVETPRDGVRATTGATDERPRASVILICRNAADTIEEALEGFAQQSWSKPWELVVLDNGSTDGTLDVVERFRDRIPAMTVAVSTKRSGVAHARNAGIEHARGDLLLFADADDVVAPGWVAALGDALETADLAVSRMDFERLNPRWAQATRSGLQETEPLRWWLGGEYFPLAHGGTYGVRREFHDRIGGFDETLPSSEDIDHIWRIQELGATVRFVPDALVYYRLRTTLRGLYRQARSYGESWPMIYKKHRARGLPPARRLSLRVAWDWLRSFRHLLLVHRKDRRARLAWDLGIRAGMVRGCVKARVLLV